MTVKADRVMESVATELIHATSFLQDNISSPRFEAELLLAHVLRCSRADLYSHSEQSLSVKQRAGFYHLLERRALREPLPYLAGRIEFYGLDINVNKSVLIPRSETETLVELALTLVPQLTPCSLERDASGVLADVGTGSGCIAIALAVHAPRTRIYATDISSEALFVARSNAQRYGVTDCITFLEADLLAGLPEPVDLILANPPYIAREEWPTLSHEVREHEPHLALYGGQDGLDIVRELLSQSPGYLRPGGAVLIEIGAGQGEMATELAQQAFSSAAVTIHSDLSGHDRVLCIRTAHFPKTYLRANDDGVGRQNDEFSFACL